MAKSVRIKILLYALHLYSTETVCIPILKTKKSGIDAASYDAKWVKARDALAEAIKLAEDNGHHSTRMTHIEAKMVRQTISPKKVSLRRMRTLTLDWKGSANPEGTVCRHTRGEDTMTYN